MLLRVCSFVIDWTVRFQQDLMKYWTRCHCSATDVALWRMRKCGFVNSLTLSEWRKCWGLSRRVSELGKIVWRTPLFCLVLHEIRVGRALTLRYTELSRSGDFSGSLLSPSVCPLTPLLGINSFPSLPNENFEVSSVWETSLLKFVLLPVSSYSNWKYFFRLWTVCFT